MCPHHKMMKYLIHEYIYLHLVDKLQSSKEWNYVKFIQNALRILINIKQIDPAE